MNEIKEFFQGHVILAVLLVLSPIFVMIIFGAVRNKWKNWFRDDIVDAYSNSTHDHEVFTKKSQEDYMRMRLIQERARDVNEEVMNMAFHSATGSSYVVPGYQYRKERQSYCEYCKTRVDDKDKYCVGCGAPV